MKIKEYRNGLTVRKKILLVSKLMGIILVVSYVLFNRMPFGEDATLWIWLGFVTVLVCVFDLWMARSVSKPLSRLDEAARSMADLDFSRPCTVTGRDELGELSRSLNRMAGSLQAAFSDLEDANSRLEQDVEQKKCLLAERKELVDNLSHEMKTPLSVIRAYAEGLQDETDETKRQKYAQVIIAETECMSGLITTLLDLSALEKGAVKLQPERFDFVELLETVAGRLLTDMPDAVFELQYELPDQPVYVNTDKNRMEQVLNNLIINARKNVRPGGILKLSLKEHEGMLDFSVYNQGPLISQENLTRIWTKFYRDGNAAYDGSGLGLVIVAQILSMQQFAYGVTNRQDGVEFYFSVPAVQ